ncbi:L,D-transpeptidase family protein [Desulfolucanica intricata]|uniref:L,D-transpeptidase family protein n=1 Tax=Desulfolucanica intricata TaxID=1285191 RepID=UPI00082F654A|nr:stalk domain-containing protein [Desulfolucanica intricata]
MLRMIVLALCLCLGGMFWIEPGEASPITTKIIINKSNNQLAFYQDGQLVRVFPVATGRHSSYTPEGSFKIVNKFVDPYYIKGRIPGGSPANPLGPRWMGLSVGGGGTYGIHGNSNPASIGTYASGGCIRMYNENVIWLYDRVPIGTPVIIINCSLDFKAQEAPEVKVALNGNVIEFPKGASTIISSDQLFLPVHKLAEQIGYQFQWDGLSKTLVLANSKKQIFFTIDSKAIAVNLSNYEADYAPILYNSCTYLPLYFFDQILGAKVSWNQQERHAILETINPVKIGEPVLYHPEVKIGDEKISLAEEEIPLLFGDHVLVPINPIGERLGLEVSWDEAREVIFVKDRENNLLILPKESNSGMLNGEDFAVLHPVVIKNGVYFVASEDLARAFNLDVQCNRSSGLLTISQK